jgi:hypothetical protein
VCNCTRSRSRYTFLVRNRVWFTSMLFVWDSVDMQIGVLNGGKVYIFVFVGLRCESERGRKRYRISFYIRRSYRLKQLVRIHVSLIVDTVAQVSLSVDV